VTLEHRCHIIFRKQVMSALGNLFTEQGFTSALTIYIVSLNTAAPFTRCAPKSGIHDGHDSLQIGFLLIAEGRSCFPRSNAGTRMTVLQLCASQN
jgi:hypothetical protein